MLAKARPREHDAARPLQPAPLPPRGHWVLCGSAETRRRLRCSSGSRNSAADGFNVMPPYFPEGFEDFVELVVPILQERGLFRADYEGTTLRDHLGLQRPGNAFFEP